MRAMSLFSSLALHALAWGSAAWAVLATERAPRGSGVVIALVPAAAPTQRLEREDVEPERRVASTELDEPPTIAFEEPEWHVEPPLDVFAAPDDGASRLEQALASTWSAPRRRESLAASAPAPPNDILAALVTPPPEPPPPRVVSAEFLHTPAPLYPRISQRLGEAGAVDLVLSIAADGTVSDVEVARSSGHHRLDEAASAAVRSWTFVPATRDGAAIPDRMRHRIVFRLDD